MSSRLFYDKNVGGLSGEFFHAVKSPENGRKRPLAEKCCAGRFVFPPAKLLESEINRIFVR